MSEDIEPAASCWEVERHSCGQVFRPYYVVILRSKRDVGKSIVKASSTDSESISEFANTMNTDLISLTNYEFMAKYQLGSAA